jgi:hypothetical protein
MDATGAGTPRCLWAFTNNVIEKYPYLHFEVENPENTTKFTFTKYWGGAPELEYTNFDGPQCINVLTMLKDQDTIGYTYIVPYVNVDTQLKIKYMYLSNVDQDGNVYVPPTQPRPMWREDGKQIRFDMPAYTENNLYEMVNETYGYGWLMSDGIKISNHEDGKGFWMERAEDSELDYINIAYVVPYEQIEKTPYLVVDVANEGRSDEGAQVSIYSYWEGMIGSAAYFDGMEGLFHGANGLNGVNIYNLKYAVDQVKEDLHGPYGIAIIVQLNLSGVRSDGTCLDPLKIDDLYLMGWEGGTDTNIELEQYMNNPTTPTTTAPAADGDTAGKFPIIPVAIAAAAVIVIAAVVVVVLKKKK